MANSELFHYRVTACCDDQDILLFFWEDTVPALSEGAYLYTAISTEFLIQNSCYFIELITGPPPGVLGVLDPAQFAYRGKSCELAPECPECVVDNNTYLITNCQDPSLSFLINISNPEALINGSVGSLNIINGDLLVLPDYNLCNPHFTIVHPEINGGVATPFSVTSFVQVNLYNGKPYYITTLDESVHGVSGLILTYYTIWSISNSRWEVWDTFDIISGPSNTTCPLGEPLAFLTSTIGDPCLEPIVTGTCSYDTGNSLGCEIRISDNRFVDYCRTQVNIEDFINCWTITLHTEHLNDVPSYSIEETYGDSCEACLLDKNQPPCISATDCVTDTVLYLTATDLLLSYVGKIIKVVIGSTIKCYKIELSNICPELPAALPGQITDCFSDCEDCLPKCSCTRAVNGGNIAKRLEYKDCNGLIQLTEEIVGAGQRSKKYCTLEWTDTDVTEVIDFGDCIDNICPEVPLPKRVVTPGYDTPICTPAQYERIVCRYAEIKYKEVLSKRYGIEDCCDDESLANDIKYELIHLQMLDDPDYVCVKNPKSCPPGCGYINMNIIHECPPSIPEPVPEPEPDPEP